jgi:hypothetical protein
MNVHQTFQTRFFHVALGDFAGKFLKGMLATNNVCIFNRVRSTKGVESLSVWVLTVLGMIQVKVQSLLHTCNLISMLFTS